VNLEDYDDAATLKVAIAAVATNDTVGTAMSHLNVSIFSPIAFCFFCFLFAFHWTLFIFLPNISEGHRGRAVQ